MIHRIWVLALCLVVAAVTERATAQTSTQMSAQTSTSASAQALSQDGWYLRTNLGFAVAPGLTVNARDNDWGTRCDKLSNPGLAETRPDECASAPPPAEWTHEVGAGDGVQSVLALGYTWNSLRFEGEYLYRTTTYTRGEGTGQILDAVTQEKAAAGTRNHRRRIGRSAFAQCIRQCVLRVQERLALHALHRGRRGAFQHFARLLRKIQAQ